MIQFNQTFFSKTTFISKVNLDGGFQYFFAKNNIRVATLPGNPEKPGNEKFRKKNLKF